MRDYFLSVSTRQGWVERHVGLNAADAKLLTKSLIRLQDEEKVLDWSLDKSDPEFYTIGFEDTLSMVMTDLRLKED